MLIDIKQNTKFDPGWQEKGGLFIARKKVNTDKIKKYFFFFQ